MISIHTPLTLEKVRSLHTGDQIKLSGTIYTARDAAHKRLIEMLDNGEKIPFDMRDAIIYFAGPAPATDDEVIGPCGPTTSYRMDAYSPRLLKEGLRGMIGKGKRSQDVIDTMKETHALYFGAIGGAGAIMADCITSCEVIAFEDLGPEAIRRLEVKDMPLTVVIDDEGHDLYEIGKLKYTEGRYAKINK